MPTPTPLCLEHNNQPCLHQRGSFSRRQAVQGEVAAYSTKPLHRHDLSSAVHVNVLTTAASAGTQSSCCRLRLQHCCGATTACCSNADAPCHGSAHEAQQQQHQRHHCRVHVLPKDVNQLLALPIALWPALAWWCAAATWRTRWVRLHVHLCSAAASTAQQGRDGRGPPNLG